MARTSNLSQPIIESLYNEALTLADEVRAVFALGLGDQGRIASSGVRLAMSSEGLKTTTRMMHLLAWLLNQRAYFSGDLSQKLLRRHSQLPEDRPPDPAALEILEKPTRALIEDTVQMHRRIARLDRAWRDGFDTAPVVHALHERIGRAMVEAEMKRTAQQAR